VAGHLSTGLIGFVDSVIAGRHGTATLAAVSVGTAVFWLPMMVPMGTLMALPPSVSQLNGSGRRDAIAPLFRQSLWLALALGVLLFAFLSLAPLALAPMGIAEDIQPGARDFLHGIRWGVPALTLYFAMRYLSDGLHWTMPTMLLGFGGLLLLVPMGYVFAFGAFGVPEMGAGSLGRAAGAGFAVYVGGAWRVASVGEFARFGAPRREPISDRLRTGLPIGVTVAMEAVLFIVTALLIVRLGQFEAAALQVAMNVASLCF